jgi:hypothetical protein
MCNKTNANLRHLRRLVAEIDSAKICTDFYWSQWDWQKFRNDIDNSHHNLIVLLAQCLPKLSILEQNRKLPDLLGESYSFVCRDFYKYLLSGNKEKFKGVFQYIFLGAISIQAQLSKEVKGWKSDAGLTISFDPVIDLMEISGYALIFSELYGISEIWNECKTIWDKYFQSTNNADELFTMLISCYTALKPGIPMPPREIIRTGWHMKFNAKLHEMGLVYGIHSYEDPFSSEKRVSHDSPIIRALCSGRSEPPEKARDIFVLLYLKKRPEAEGVEIQDMFGLERRITREERQNNGGDT